MLYARSDVKSYTPPGGICRGHKTPADKKSVHPITGQVHFSISCEKCEEALAFDNLWARDLDDVPLTHTEEKSVEAKKHEGAQAMAGFSQEFIKGFTSWMASQQQGKK